MDDDGNATLYEEQAQFNLEALERCFWHQARLDELHAIAAQLGVGAEFAKRHPEVLR